MNSYAYKFTPSILDSFEWFKKNAKDNAFQEFIDTLNRVKTTNEAVRRGTAFNNIVDLLCEKKIDLEQIPCVDGVLQYRTEIDGIKETHKFPLEIVQKYVKRYQYAVRQVYVEAPLKTKYGLVLLYGFADEVLFGRVEDIKTCREYTFGKYLNNFQHHVYPYCLNYMGNQINSFVYTPTDFKEMFDEEYSYDSRTSEIRLQLACTDLIEFCDTYRYLITNPKIYGGEYSTSK